MDYPTRTGRQPLRWRCKNPACIEDDKKFEFDGDYPTCPKCGASGFPYVVLLTLVHMLVPDPNGKISGQHGRLRMLCDDSRGFVTDGKNNEAGTGVVGATTCPGCRAEIKRLKIKDNGQPVKG